MRSSSRGLSQKIQNGQKIIELEDRLIEMINFEEQIEKGLNKNEWSLRDLWDSIRHTNTHGMVALK